MSDTNHNSNNSKISGFDMNVYKLVNNKKYYILKYPVVVAGMLLISRFYC